MVNREAYPGQRIRETERTASNINRTADRLIKAAGNNASRVARINEIRDRYLKDVPSGKPWRYQGRQVGARTNELARMKARENALKRQQVSAAVKGGIAG